MPPLLETLTIRELIAELAKVADAERASSTGQPETRMRTGREQELIEELHRRRDELAVEIAVEPTHQ